ncbi:MAG: hypothetical protein Kow0020_05410 [Wenzhouxiangellaceae bacterium]
MNKSQIGPMLAAFTFAAALITGAQAADERLSASIIEARDSLVSFPIGKEHSVEFSAEQTTMIYRESDIGRDGARPVMVQLQGDVVARLGKARLASNWILYDPAEQSLLAAELAVAQENTQQTITPTCQSGESFINGEGTGTYPTADNPRLDLIPGAQISCAGNRVRAIFTPRQAK